MTPKKKAKELIDRFMEFTPADEELEYPYSVKCSIICVNEIIGGIISIIGSEKQFWRDGEKSQYEYYNEVLTELKK